MSNDKALTPRKEGFWKIARSYLSYFLNTPIGVGTATTYSAPPGSVRSSDNELKESIRELRLALELLTVSSEAKQMNNTDLGNAALQVFGRDHDEIKQLRKELAERTEDRDYQIDLLNAAVTDYNDALKRINGLQKTNEGLELQLKKSIADLGTSNHFRKVLADQRNRECARADSLRTTLEIIAGDHDTIGEPADEQLSEWALDILTENRAMEKEVYGLQNANKELEEQLQVEVAVNADYPDLVQELDELRLRLELYANQFRLSSGYQP